MEISWLEAVSGITHHAFVVVAGSVIATRVVRAAVGRDRFGLRIGDHPQGIRPLLEYVGNVQFETRTSSPIRLDPRVDTESRARLDWVRQEMHARGLAAGEAEIFMEDVRQVFEDRSPG